MERIDKRDFHFSHRHRLYGSKLLMLDIDFVEMNGLKPVLAGDLKHGNIKEIDTNSYQFQCYKSIFTCPIIALVYWYLGEQNQILHAEDTNSKVSHTQYLAVPINTAAQQLLENKPQKMSEWDYIRLLHSIRNESLPPTLQRVNFSTTWKQVSLPNIK